MTGTKVLRVRLAFKAEENENNFIFFFLVVETSNFHRGIRLLNKGPHQWAVQHETQVITTFTCVLLCSFTFYLIDVRVRISDHRLLTTLRNTSGFKFKFFSV